MTGNGKAIQSEADASPHDVMPLNEHQEFEGRLPEAVACDNQVGNDYSDRDHFLIRGTQIGQILAKPDM